MSEIVKIVRPRYNGMYRDNYNVQYKKEDGSSFWRTYTIHGEMIQKHFNFMLTYAVTPIYSPFSGVHTMDVWERR